MNNPGHIALVERSLAIAVIVIVLYPLSFGPACWLLLAGCLPDSVLVAYEPLGLVTAASPQPVSDALLSYAFFWN